VYGSALADASAVQDAGGMTMQRRGSALIASVLAGTLLLIALCLFLGSTPTNAAFPDAKVSAAKRDAGVELSPGESREANPGETVTYTHVITNTGCCGDTFEIEALSLANWPIELLGDGSPEGTRRLSLSLGEGMTVTFEVSTTVPTTATGGSVDAVVTATSQFDTNVQDVITDTVIVRAYIHLPLVLRNYPPPWQQANHTGGISFYDVAPCPSNHLLQYAGTTSNGLYHSTDGGEDWQHWGFEGWATPVVWNPANCSEAFVAVWGEGVYRVAEHATPINQGLNEPYLYSLAISPDGQTLYAGSREHGVFKTDTTSIDWTPINEGISDQRIRSLYIISDTLYAGSRECTFYYSDDGGSSWESEAILDGGKEGDCGDAQVWAIEDAGGVLYASLGLSKGLYRRPAAGDWEQVSDVPAVDIFRFGLLHHQSHLYVSTYGHGVYTCGGDGHCQPLPNGGLRTPNIRGLEVASINGEWHLLAGSDDGVWWVPLAD